MNPLLISDRMPKLSHRLLWWLLAHQGSDANGVPNGQVAAGWRSDAMQDLNISDVNLWRATKWMVGAGIVECPQWSKTLVIRGEAFR